MKNKLNLKIMVSVVCVIILFAAVAGAAEAAAEEEGFITILINFLIDIFSGGITGASVLDDPALIGYWNFDEGSGTIASDLSTQNIDGIVNGGATWITGIKGNALSFDGINDYVQIPDDPVWDTGDYLTISLWFRTNTVQGSYNKLLVHDRDFNEQRYYIDPSTSGGIRFCGSYCTPYSVNLVDGEWHHVVGVFDRYASDYKYKLYIDNSLAATTPGGDVGLDEGDKGITIGEFANNYFTGDIDEVRIYSRPLSEEEVGALYEDCMINVKWDRPLLDLGSVLKDSGDLQGRANVIATGTNDNVNIACVAGGDCAVITPGWTSYPSMTDQSVSLMFTCLDDNEGSYSATFQVTSDQDALPDEITVSCEITPPTIEWDQPSLDLGSGQIHKNDLLGNADLTAVGTHTNINVECISGDCLPAEGSIMTVWSYPPSMADETQAVTFRCSDDYEGIYSATFQVTSNQDTTPDQITVSCAIFSPAVEWDKTNLDLAGQPGTTPTDTANIIATGLNPNVAVTCSGDCSKIQHDWTTKTMDGETLPVIFTCDGSTEGSYSATFGVVSGADTTADTLAVSCDIVAEPAPPCGTTLTESTTLFGDVGPCSTSYGLVIGADNVVLNCAGRKITGVPGAYIQGIYINGKNNVTIKNCEISGVYNALHIFGTVSDITISGNTLIDNQAASYGVFISKSLNGVIKNNVISNGGYGIRLDAGSSQNQVLDNSISNIGSMALYFVQATDNTITGNTVVDSGYGIWLYNSNNNLIYNNYFNNTVKNAQDVGGVNTWNIAKTYTAEGNIIGEEYLGGNYWSDYAGEDTNDDGLGDTLLPYNSNGDIATGGDYLPLVMEVAGAPCTDNDGDGYFIEGMVPCGTEVDCNDNNPAINPGATEVCDGIDNNCDVDIDGASSGSQTGVDDDGDNYCDGALGGDDCDDTDPAINPGTGLCEPVVENVALSPVGTILADKNITVSYTLKNTAAQGIINWNRDGSSIMAVNMPFEGHGGDESTTAVDYSGYDNNGNVIGATWNPTGGYDGFGAYDFDGNDDYISIPSSSSLTYISHEVTASLWFSTSTSQARNMLIHGDDSFYYKYHLDLTDNSRKISFCVKEIPHGGRCASYDTGQAGYYSTGEWHHVVGVYDSDAPDGYRIKLYIDGILQGQNYGGGDYLASSTYPLSIGKYGNAHFTGSIDKVKIYNKALSAEQVKAIFEGREDLIVSQETYGGETWEACVTPNDRKKDGVQVCSNSVEICADNDGDGYYAQEACGIPVDCDDTNPDINPGETEICNGIDDDCDGSIDEDITCCGDTIYSDTDLTQDLVCPSHAIFIGADNIVLDCKDHSITSTTSSQNGVFINGHNDVTVKNCKINNFAFGINVIYGLYNTLTDNTLDGCSYGIILGGSNSTTITDNVITNSNRGIRLYLGSSDNTITSNIIEDSPVTGIRIENSQDNLIYNNYLNNTNNAYDDGANDWNTEKTYTAEGNIIGEAFIAGNYWATPAGDGYSEICADFDPDAICDYKYEIPGGSNNDFLPLTVEGGGASCSDDDGDGVYKEGGWCGPIDCDDGNDQVYPGATEVCDGIDNDCNGATDEGLTPPLNSKQLGVCAGSTQTCDGVNGWIDDYSGVAYYESTEATCDGKDNDCDGYADALTPGVQVGVDDDGDDYCDHNLGTTLYAKDCVDDTTNDPAVCSGVTIGLCENIDYSMCAFCRNPGATEISDNIDNDCDGMPDYMDSDCITRCGDTIYQAGAVVKLDQDLLNCPGGGIVINTDNVVLDCQGNSITGSHAGYFNGVSSINYNSNTVKNCTISNFYSGIHLEHSSNNNIIDNTIGSTARQNRAIHIGEESFGNNIIGNNITGDLYYGIQMKQGSHSNIITNNTLEDTKSGGILVEGYCSLNTITNNIIKNPGVWGIRLLLYSNQNQIKDNTVEYSLHEGILVDPGSQQNILTNNRACYSDQANGGYYDINDPGESNTFTDNICGSASSGISCYSCHCRSTITSDLYLTEDLVCPDDGITVGADNVILDCQDNSIIGSGTGTGIYVDGSDSAIVRNCNIDNFDYGLIAKSAISGSITQITAENNNYGIMIDGGLSNSIYYSTVRYNQNDGFSLIGGTKYSNLYDTHACFNAQAGGGYYDINDQTTSTTFLTTPVCDIASSGVTCDMCGAENVVLSSTYGTNTADENLTVSYNIASTVRGITDWSKDGSYTILNLPFEGHAGDETATAIDYSSNNNNGAVVDATWNPTGGYIGGGYEFDGVNDYINIPDSSIWDTGSELTVSLWFKTDTQQNTGYILVHEEDFNEEKYMITLGGNSGDISFSIRHDEFSTRSAYHNTGQAGYYSTGEWHHVVGVFDRYASGGRLKLYVDGILSATNPGDDADILEGDKGITIGRYGGLYYFKGSIDEVKIYDKALSAEQVKALYEGREDLIVSQETSPGEIWQACITPNDGTKDSTPACSNGLQIEFICDDSDGDGYGVCPNCGIANTCLYDGNDCDDDNGQINPGIAELCDGIDNNCDGNYDETFDADGDTYTTCGTRTTTGESAAPDCNDNNPSVYPGAAEQCNNNVDDDCDALIDCADGDCWQNTPQITSCCELQEMRQDLAGNYVLMNDIDCSDTVSWDTGLGFEPIGTFTGNFDGQNYKITGLYINRTATGNVGLFGYVSGAEVKNVGLENVIIEGSVKVGGLIGYSVGSTISNSYATGSVSAECTVGGLIGEVHSGSVTDSYSSSTVTQNDDACGAAGGFVGLNRGSIFNSNSTADITAPTSYHCTSTGGFVGSNTGTMDNCLAGDVNVIGRQGVGGFVGTNTGSITNSDATNVNVDGFYTYIGGFVGDNNGASAVLTNTYTTGYIEGPSNVGGIFGTNRNGGTIDSSNTDVTTVVIGSEKIGGLGGYNGGTVSNSYAKGSISAPTATSVGGMIGYNDAIGVVSDSYTTVDITGNDQVGGAVGTNLGTLSNSFSLGSVTGTTNVGGLVGSNTGTITNDYWYDNPTDTADSCVGNEPSSACDQNEEDLVHFYDNDNAPMDTWDFVDAWEPTVFGLPGLGDVPEPPCADEDNDGVCDELDKCVNVPLPPPSADFVELRPDHHQLEGQFGWGCTCEEALFCKPGDNNGEYKYGCTPGTENVWLSQTGWSTDCQANGVVAMAGEAKPPLENTDSDMDGIVDALDPDNDGDNIEDVADSEPDSRAEQTGDYGKGKPDWWCENHPGKC
ncbi:right-handed parallel beta-helix repeat-containing protein [Candidatus Woesearchaeota archaeon]|nr:right-handed parallel beta-helix repeat-containing protein [Candidatus Woesearchaeota archaeon]